MQRNLPALSDQSFDLLVIGGGIHGACVAWEATLRGLSVALVEQSDFASGTSANSLKVIHGGLRYLQTADLRRMRQSIRERQTLMRIAPHLVHPLPVLVPTYGHSLKGKEAMTAALKINDWISCDRNLYLTDPQKHIPAGQMLSKQECLAQLPDLPPEGLTGAACFYDAQVYNSEQLVLAFLQSAAQRGAQVANHTRVVNLLKEGDRVVAATAQDQLTGDRFTIQAKTIVNASGPWINQLISSAIEKVAGPQPLAKAMNLVTRPLFGPQQKCAVGITGRAPGSRLFFIAPWRSRSLVGTWYGPDSGHSKPPSATSAEIESFLADINQAYPSFNLTPDDVQWVHTGLLPSYGISSKTGEVQLTKQFQLKDHRREGLSGLLSVAGVKYTTARDLACRAVDWVFRDRSQISPLSLSHQEPLYGGQISQFQRFTEAAVKTYGQKIPAQTLQQLVHNYGANYPKVLQQVSALEHDASSLSDQRVLAAEVKYNLRNTMPQTLSDVVFRRTELGAVGHPGDEVLQLCGHIMGEALGWSPQKRQAEVQQVQQHLEQQRSGRPSEQQSSGQVSVRPPCPV
ncbi:glycerol-3-phosphate dehydrogenase/oxidase [Leptolyngbya sp. BC1307]|uniref:glycerol-3-phosphate dehydrogenase/oxidase n=1 Tax=Leptolyngbya sp. BC1307 TaxID=2029589 RepID=UPI000EFCEFB0|nr:glycerol-3-phosphate dehydrogenase/oxidase [Leptolyngbya sp. BC1307]